MGDGTVEAVFPYSYQAGDGRVIEFETGDRFTLLNKTNVDWWQVTRKDTTEEKPMYVPASYMKEITPGRRDPIYENVEKFDHHETCNGAGSKENVSTSDMRSCHSITGNSQVSNDANCSDYPACNNGTGDENASNASRALNDFNGVTNGSSRVNPLAKSLESSGNFSSPRKERPKSQSLPTGWVQVTDEASGRLCYYNTHTEERSWKPPRISQSRTPPPNGWQTPPLGWRISRSGSTDELVYVNDFNDEEWMPSKDEEGRDYYYLVNGNTARTSWELPELEPARQSFEALDVTYRRRSPNLSLRTSKCQSLLTSSPRNSQANLTFPPPSMSAAAVHGFPPPPPLVGSELRSSLKVAKRSASVQSRESVSSADEWPTPPTPSTDFVDFFQAIEKQGMLNCKKLVEGGGKKVKKMSWTPTFVILFSANLVFYKDQKAAAQKPGHPQGKPQSCCPLQGATLEWGSSSTKKKNAFQIKAFSGAVYLLQHDHQVEATNWFSAISGVIKKLNEEEPLPPQTPVQDQPQRGADNDAVSQEPGTPISLQPVDLVRIPSIHKRGVDREDKRNMREKLRKFLTKRPPIEELEKKGIIKESVFGCHIAHLCERQKTTVPVFVSSCIAAIEKRGLSFDGLYRVCGNVSTVQKLRIMVDQEEKVVLGEPPFDDVHALTGSLKLYFRELPEPLIPYDFFSGFVEAIKQSTRKSKLTAMRSLAVQMPKVNGETLKLLLRHLRKLMDQSEENRMNAQNLAIVWGPNLMWPRYDSGDIAVNMVHQNQIIEFLLLEFDHVFK
ncbi:rho GTPase-activating protein 12-like isoform X1 [Pocillopora verrucosa]|uniref:rho GTPase-activating protein 12-like isoform X1 n=1 Tax=Pocillopora verrucosa TaxID=203993 RepID=UPI003341C6D5